MFEYPPAPDVPPPPPPEAPAGSARYVYLLGRLRGRQITMEEATELFSIQQGMMRSATTRAARSSAPRAERSRPAPAVAVPIAPMSDEGLALSLLALGVGAGLFAALLKRAREGPPTPSTR